MSSSRGAQFASGGSGAVHCRPHAGSASKMNFVGIPQIIPQPQKIKALRPYDQGWHSEANDKRWLQDMPSWWLNCSGSRCGCSINPEDKKDLPGWNPWQIPVLSCQQTAIGPMRGVWRVCLVTCGKKVGKVRAGAETSIAEPTWESALNGALMVLDRSVGEQLLKRSSWRDCTALHTGNWG